MFGIEWLRGGSILLKEVSAHTSLADVKASLLTNAARVAQSYPNHEPDAVRIMDAGGNEITRLSIAGD
jgi:hypothetical protein